MKEANVFNIIEWTSKQKPAILMGIILSISSFLLFLNYHGHNCSDLELLLYGILFCASSFLISHIVFTLYKKKKRNDLNPYYGNPPKEAIKILELFSNTDILSQQEILFKTQLDLSKFRYLIDQLHGREFLEMFFATEPDLNRYCLREKGRIYMVKKKILK